MQETIYGVFTTITDAKVALGQIKKVSWNKADLAVLFETEPPVREDHYMELAAEGFIGTIPHHAVKSDWPGIQEIESSVLGKICYGSSRPYPPEWTWMKEGLEALHQEIAQHKVVAVIEAEPEILSTAQFILESNGGEIINSLFSRI